MEEEESAAIAALVGDEIDNLSPEEMQKKIEELESAIASVEQNDDTQKEEDDFEKIRKEIAMLDEEIAKFSSTPELAKLGNTSLENQSIYVGNVDYGATAEELQNQFISCGDINRCTIMCNKFSGQPLGYAYIEFSSEDAVIKAMDLNDTLFRGRQLKVVPKRVNVPGLRAIRGRGRGARRPSYPTRRRPSYYSSGYSPRRPRRRFHPYATTYY
eukprot:NODE_7526_length_768_cov_34.147287_g6914_i0.p1 GENE.NODE_7526_length_768_cov_34.147287_g6914_i0~~NODE_7526_length_768_cov_34.147287_g6914_i0.p1  ORF type:complete len:214 (+),score=38.97 NODE_7526_length_768_cov_34.147287_g6914_i0:71-712(+)